MTQREEFLSFSASTSPGPGPSGCWTGWTTRPTSLPARRPPGSTGPVREGCACTASTSTTPSHDRFFQEGDSEESFAICALLHDLCKANYYKVSTRNVKNDATGQWEKVPYYTVEDQFPYGHGEKSVFLIERFMRLKTEEAVAIRWHMGGL